MSLTVESHFLFSREQRLSQSNSYQTEKVRSTIDQKSIFQGRRLYCQCKGLTAKRGKEPPIRWEFHRLGGIKLLPPSRKEIPYPLGLISPKKAKENDETKKKFNYL